MLNNRWKALIAVAALVAAAATLGVTVAGGQSEQGSPRELRPGPQASPNRDLSLKSCDARFDHYYVGSSFRGLSLVKELQQCSQPQPERTAISGGDVDPDSLMRPHFVSSIYGECDPSDSETGCHPPLEIQSWPACERSPGDYTFGEPGATTTLEPSETVQVRGVPARFYGDNRLEVTAGDVTVVLFGDSKELLMLAAQALGTASDSPDKVLPAEALPRPVAGAQDGTLPC
jgi:hypothetical protein